jgi:hypothetical protein
MPDPTLMSGQYSIGHDGGVNAIIFGSGANSLYVQNTAIDTGTINVQDQPVVGHDGLVFGVDTLPGMVITYTGIAYTEPGQGDAAMDAYSALAGIWNDPTIRLTDGVVQVLRAWYTGSNVVRRAYGRGRQIMPTMGSVFQGLVPFTAAFQCADNTWYEDAQNTLTLGLAPSFFGTLTPPLTPPYQLSATNNYQQNILVNSGSLPTWPVFTFKGPVTNPGLTFVNTPVSAGYTGSLGVADTLVIDTRPWARTVLLNGTSAAGSYNGSALIAMQLQTGSTLVHYTGQDPTGKSQCVITWRNATQSIGGSY